MFKERDAHKELEEKRKKWKEENLVRKADMLLLKNGFNSKGGKHYYKRQQALLKIEEKPEIFNDYVRRTNKDLIEKRQNAESSSGENRIAAYLSKKRYFFQREKTMMGLYNNAKPLFLDFWLPRYKLAIEFDGQHHFKDKNKMRLAEQKKKDVAKDLFCVRNKYNMLRIAYFKSNRIEQLIDDKIKEIKAKERRANKDKQKLIQYLEMKRGE